MSKEKIYHLRAMGAEVVVTRSDVMKGHEEYYQEIAEKISKEENAFISINFVINQTHKHIMSQLVRNFKANE